MMRTLQFYFAHPAKGQATLNNPICPLQSKTVPFDTHQGYIADIIIDELSKGEWTAVLEWEHEGHNFLLEKDFSV